MYDSMPYIEEEEVKEEREKAIAQRNEMNEMLLKGGFAPLSPMEPSDEDQSPYGAGKEPRNIKFDLYCGLGAHPDRKCTPPNTPLIMLWFAMAIEKSADLSLVMISLYIPGIYNYLILPRQLRSVERGLFMPTDPTKSLIRVHEKRAINTTSKFIWPEIIEQDMSLKLDMTKILEGHLGVQVVWQPFDIPEPEDANKLMVDLAEAGLCFIRCTSYPSSGRLHRTALVCSWTLSTTLKLSKRQIHSR